MDHFDGRNIRSQSDSQYPSSSHQHQPVHGHSRSSSAYPQTIVHNLLDTIDAAAVRSLVIIVIIINLPIIMLFFSLMMTQVMEKTKLMSDWQNTNGGKMQQQKG